MPVFAMSCSTARFSTLYARLRSSSRVGDATTTRSGPTPQSDTNHQHRGVRARIRRVAGCATPTGSAGHAGATANLTLKFTLDHLAGADHSHKPLFFGELYSSHRPRLNRQDLLWRTHLHDRKAC